MTRILLASQSKGRAQMLRDAGVDFVAEPALLDEAALMAALAGEGQSPRNIADALAEAKAIKISARRPGQLVIGSDQLLVLDDGSLLAKPATPAEAEAQLAQLSGQRHRLLSAVVVAENGAVLWRHVSEARLWVRPLSADFIAAYVAQHWDRICWTVGCYEVEGAGVQLFSRTEGDRWTIIGLPMLPLLGWLRERGEITQ
ncbi:MAG: Maf family protein [Sphingopyxis sp.]|nr:Maf family protein [Sphingopyxis sp.]